MPMIEIPIFIQHVFSLLFAPAFLGGIMCLAAGLSCVDRALEHFQNEKALLTRKRQPPQCGADSDENHVFRQNDALKHGVFQKQNALNAAPSLIAAPCPVPTSRRALQTGGMACALGSFLLLPTGAFPAYIACTAAMPVWLLLFAMACVALDQYAPQALHSTGSALAAPFFLKLLLSRLAIPGLVFALCARYAWQHGFPGNIWAMDVYVALPLYTGAELGQVTGFIVLATVMVLWGAALPICHKAPVLSACVRLAAAQFTVCLFLPAPYVRLYIWPAASTQATQTILPALLTDYVLNWGLVLSLCLLFRVIGCIPFAPTFLNVSLPVLLTLGATLCLW